MASDLNWFIKRLSAMNSKEVAWRVGQSLRYKQESVRFKKPQKVTEKLFSRKYSKLQAEPKRLGLNLRNEFYTLGTSIPLLGDFKYEDYKKDWFQGFGGKGTSPWPMIPSSKLNYRERNDIGDARMNWELNKHFQFAMLAKNYYASGDSAFLDELIELFNDWNDKNPFLWGISWVSAIEIAERSMNWCYMYAFLEASLRKEFHKDSAHHKKSKNKQKKANKNAKSHSNSASTAIDASIPDNSNSCVLKVPSEDAVKIQILLDSIRIGVVNMADYISHHYSQFSSANNHLIVEISAVLHAGILFDYKPWIELAERILTREIFLQNFSDGINKEQSEYYQTFEMEVLALDLRLLKLNDIEPSKSWDELLKNMSRYISNSIGDHGEIISFGDDDDGRIIDFHGGCNHFKYTLELMGLLLDERYTELNLPDISETVLWLFSKEDVIKSQDKSYYRRKASIIRPEGGMTVFRSVSDPAESDDKGNGSIPDILIGIDHAPLGYGSIAAHAHSDALSFQMFADGTRIFADPGTYIYHCDTESRNDFRRTNRHNTICINGIDQSEMLGPFLWGRKATCTFEGFKYGDDIDEVMASHDGYTPIKHTRKFTFKKKEGILLIEDWLTKNKNPFVPDASHNAVFNLLLGEKATLIPTQEGTSKNTLAYSFESSDSADSSHNQLNVTIEFVSGFGEVSKTEKYISTEYGIKKLAPAIEAPMVSDHAITRISLKKG